MTDKDWRAIKTFIQMLPSFLPPITNLSPHYRKSSLPFVVKNLLGNIAANFTSLIAIADPIIIVRNADAKEALKVMTKKKNGILLSVI